MNYELMIILKPLLPEDIRGGVLKRLEKLISKQEGKVLKQDVWGKKHLAYPIKKHEEGYYIVYNLELSPGSIKGIQNELKLFNDILRYILIKKD